MRYLRRLARLAFLGCSLLAATPLQAGADVMRVFSKLAAGNLAWETLEHTTLAGQPLYWRSFESGDKLLVVAAQLSQFSGVFQRALVLDNKVLLSGNMSHQHWLADLTATPTGVKGVVSMMLLSGVVRHESGPQALAWLNQFARQRHHQVMHSAQAMVTQQVYSATAPPDRLARVIRERLLLDGWASDSATSLGAFEQWRKGKRTVAFSLHQVASETAVFVHLAEPPQLVTGG